MKSKPSAVQPNQQARQAEADKISRLRALRLAKEAADKEEAAAQAALAAEQVKPKRSRVRASTPRVNPVAAE